MKTETLTGVSILTRISLYPTFKEWKLRYHPSSEPLRTSCLYPTFKEWKPLWTFSVRTPGSVYILPLRNEN